MLLYEECRKGFTGTTTLKADNNYMRKKALLFYRRNGGTEEMEISN